MSFFSHIEVHKSLSYKFKFLIISRSYDNLKKRFRLLLDINTYLHFNEDDKSQRIDQNINLIIDYEMSRIAKGFSVEYCKRIIDRLKEMNNRIYLWLFLTIDIITRSRSKYDKISNIDSLLFDLLLKVSNAYERILSRSSDNVRARILL